MPGWKAKTIRDLGNQLSLAQERQDGTETPRRQGRAVFLIGAGCSQSAGIPIASQVAQYAAIYLDACYSSSKASDKIVLCELADHRSSDFRQKAMDALGGLERAGKLLDLEGVDIDKPNWGDLYTYFFESHLTAPNRQREFLAELIHNAGGRLNWAHACLGELVHQGYVGTIMTTNFDQLAFQAVTKTGTLPVIADGLEALDRILAEPAEPQIIYLHGSMHTYSPRNNRIAVRGTGGHKVLPAVLYSLLHRSDVLVVVGYAGGEEGVMQLLHSIAQQLPSLVIFWVLYETDESALSQRAAELLSIGENKFLLTGLGADELFRDLMNELGIGAPGWIDDPLARLTSDADLVQGVADDSDVSTVIGRSKELAAAAAAGKKVASPLQAAAAHRLASDYDAALKAFEGIDTAEARIFRAETRYRMAQESRKPEERVAQLERAMDELDGLPGGLAVAQSEFAALVRFRTLVFKRDAADDDSDDMRNDIIAAAKAWLGLPPGSHRSDRKAEVLVGLGQAYLEDGERDPTKNSARFEEALKAFDDATVLLRRPGSRQLIEAKEGKASVLEFIGNAKKGDPGQQQEALRRAINEHLQLVEMSTASSNPADQASRCENAANAIVRLADTYEGGDRIGLRRQADGLLRQASALYAGQEGKAEDYARVEKLRRDLRF